MDAITLLKKDHKTVEKLFKQFEKSGSSDSEARRKLVDQIIEELSVHASIEEQVFYPAVREDVPDAEDEVLRVSRSTTSSSGPSRSWRTWTRATSASRPR
jgi:hemerythrin superfamily protein